jgi:hypothetical protein
LTVCTESKWTPELGVVCIREFLRLTRDEQAKLLTYLNVHFPPSVYREHRAHQRDALDNVDLQRDTLRGVKQRYPSVINADEVYCPPDGLKGCAIVLTAGGEGERLRRSLLARGVCASRLRDFVKAIYELPYFVPDFGALQTNLAMIAGLCREFRTKVPVVVTTGPDGSINHRRIVEVVNRHDRFGLGDHLTTVSQDERLHLTLDGRIVWIKTESGDPQPITNPDETGGPLIKLARCRKIRELVDNGYTKLLLLQGTAVYDPKVVLQMAAAARYHDAVGVGIPRQEFPADDVFGSYVVLEEADGTRRLNIIEKGVRNDETRNVKSPDGRCFLPKNTGLFVLDLNILEDLELPDYATPPKEMTPDQPGLKAPKIGYAATDVLPQAKEPAILAVTPDRFAVIKDDGDLAACSAVALRFTLDKYCI